MKEINKMTKKKTDRNREIIEAAKEHRRKKQTEAMFDNEEEFDRVFDINIIVRDLSVGYEGEGLSG